MNKNDLEKLANALEGLCILGTLPGSPADLAGLRYGDVVLEVNGHKTSNWVEFLKAVHEHQRIMQVRYFRAGAEHNVDLTLPAERPASLFNLVASRVLSYRDAETLLQNDAEPDASFVN